MRVGFRHSIKFRTTAALALAMFIAFAVSASVSSWRTFQTELEKHQTVMAAIANVLSSQMGSSVRANYKKGVLVELRAMREFPNVKFASVKNQDGKQLAQLGTGTFLARNDNAMDEVSNIALLGQDTIWVNSDIVHGGETIGQLSLLTNISHIRGDIIDSLVRNLIVALISIFLAIAIAYFWISKITAPISKLSNFMMSLGNEKNYEMRYRTAAKGEVAVLAASFNAMMSSIHQQDQELKGYQENLEEMVDTRTKQLETAKVVAETANKAKSDFLATMSHEIRTPMNGMMVMAEMLNAAPLSDRHRRYANVIARSGNSLLNIINDILDISKIEAGKLELEMTSVYPDQIVEDVANLFWDKASEKNLQLATYVEPQVPFEFLGDPTRLNQVVTNLVNNALKFTETGSVSILIKTLDTPSAHATLRIEVVDTGIGIAEDKLEQIFERFSQEDQSTTRKFGGTGLGLAICQRLVEAMDGRIGVSSTQGQGSTFWVEFSTKVLTPGIETVDHAQLPTALLLLGDDKDPTLLAQSLRDRGVRMVNRSRAGETVCDFVIGETPLLLDYQSNFYDENRPAMICLSSTGDHSYETLIEQEMASDLLEIPFSRKSIGDLVDRMVKGSLRGRALLEDRASDLPVYPDFNGMRVLAVDDNAVNREVLRDVLHTLGAGVTLAVNGEEAIELSRNAQYDLIFMDCSMPGIDGFEATKIIRLAEEKSGQHTPIVALTAHISGDDAERWRSVGMDGYLSKPFTIEGIVEVLSTYNNQAETGAISLDAEEATAQGDLDRLEAVDLISPKTLELLARLEANGTARMAEKIFGMYLEHSKLGLLELQKSFQSKDLNSVASAAHSLKSMSHSAGASKVAEICDQIERNANQAIIEQCLAGLGVLADALSQTTASMQERIAQAA